MERDFVFLERGSWIEEGAIVNASPPRDSVALLQMTTGKQTREILAGQSPSFYPVLEIKEIEPANSRNSEELWG